VGHGHSHGDDLTHFRLPVAVARALTVMVAALAVATVLGVAWLWPRGPAHTLAGVDTTVDLPSISAVVTSLQARTCQGTSDDRAPDGTQLTKVACGRITVTINEGSQAGTSTTVDVTGPVLTAGITPGDKVFVQHLPAEAGLGPNAYAWRDFDRRVPIGLMAAIFAVLVAVVARWRGLIALAGLGAALVTVLVFILPALRRGENASLVGLVGSTTIMIVILYAAHGVSAKTTTALLGTVAGLSVTTALGWWAAPAAHLTGITGPDSYSLSQLIGQQAVAAVVQCGLILAGLGVLNDVTVTQASAVWELHAAAPHLPARQLFTRGMRIGRDHLASTVYTIAFAYAAASLGSLMLIEVYATPFGTALNSGAVAQEVVGILVGGIGLILSIPLTTAIAAAIVSRADTLDHAAWPVGDAVDAHLKRVDQPPEDGEGHGSAVVEGSPAFVDGVLVRRRQRHRS
jgi:uncharacterized membrane protein